MVRINASLLLAAATASLAYESSYEEPVCTKLSQRRAWHTFTDDEKHSYIKAELCLMDKEATLGLPGAKNMFEELQATHQRQADITHQGAFLPFHRLLMHAHEKLLQQECGYKGTQPYWDEPREAGKFSKSDIFDPVTGFGGDGVGDEGCIADGPFAGYVNSLGPGFQVTDHCITRFISDEVSLGSSQKYVDKCYEYDTFVKAWLCLEGLPHRGGHGGVGGLMRDPIASPGDPLFYLHHTWLDKVWWDWQALDLPARLTDIGGPNLQGSYEGFPEDLVEDFWGFIDENGGPPPSSIRGPDIPVQIPEGDPAGVTTLDHILNMFGVYRNATIGEVMDIGGELLCYEYV